MTGAAPDGTALVVVDLQNDFCTGPAARARFGTDTAVLERAVAGCVRAVAQAREQGVEVLFVRFVGDPEHQGPGWRLRDRTLGRRPKCLEGSWGARFHALVPAPGERVFTKRACFDAFLSDGFEEYLGTRGVGHVVLAGLYADVCGHHGPHGVPEGLPRDRPDGLHGRAAPAVRRGAAVHAAGLRRPDHHRGRRPGVDRTGVPSRGGDVRATAGLNPAVAAGVGRTALLVAAARAIETHRPDALAQDPLAEHFVRAAPASAGWPVRPEQVPAGEADPLWGRLGRYFGLRTRVLDDHLLHAARQGVRQVVLLGAGLDCRAFRLDWPPGCVVHEVDTAGMLTFKQAVLDRAGAAPRPGAGSFRPISGSTGPRLCRRRVSTPPRPPRGSPRGCCSTSRRRPNAASWRRSTG